MTDEQKAAFIMSQVACMIAELESMKAANELRRMQGHTIAYDEDAFLSLQSRYYVSHNAVVGFFR